MASSIESNYIKLTQNSIPKLIIKLSIPTIISMLVTALYSLADTYFVSQINTQATAAVGISFSIMAILQAMGFFFGHGSGNYISRELGAKRVEEATKMAATGFYYALAGGFLAMAVGIYFLTPISQILGSTDTVLPYTEKYLGLILLGAPIMTASFTLNNQMRLQGNAISSMIGVVTGVFINLILDPILIFVFNLGITGAGLATLIGQACSFLLLLYLAHKGSTLPIRISQLSFSWTYLKEIIHGGTPSLTRQGLASLSTILLNVAAGSYGDAAIASMTIVNRIGFFVQAFIIGFGQGFQPVCGFNFGAKLYHRVLEGFYFCVRVSFVFLLICTIICWFSAEGIVALFREGDAEVINIGASALRWQCIAFPLTAWTTISNMMLQTIRKSVRATILSSARQGLFFIPLIFILPRFFGLEGIEMCQGIADIITFILAIPLTYGVLMKMQSFKR